MYCHTGCHHSQYHDDVINWKPFPRYWPFVRGTHRSPVNSPHKGQRREALMFSLICTWINGWVNISEAGDLRRHRAHYDVIVMQSWCRCLYLYLESQPLIPRSGIHKFHLRVSNFQIKRFHEVRGYQDSISSNVLCQYATTLKTITNFKTVFSSIETSKLQQITLNILL